MSTRRLEIEKEIRECLDEFRDSIAAVYLFGSVQRGTDRPTSDVDVAILFRVPQPKTIRALPFEIEGNLEAKLEKPVQVIDLDRASPDLAHRILFTGSLILELDRRKRIEFEVRTRNMYFDIEPFLRRYRQVQRHRT